MYYRLFIYVLSRQVVRNNTATIRLTQQFLWSDSFEICCQATNGTCAIDICMSMLLRSGRYRRLRPLAISRFPSTSTLEIPADCQMVSSIYIAETIDDI